MKTRTIKTQIDNKIKLIDLSWERAFLILTIDIDYAMQPRWYFALMNRHMEENEDLIDEDEYDIQKLVEIKPTKINGKTYIFQQNITAVDGKDFLDNGKWRILVDFNDGQDLHLCTVTTDVAYKLKNEDRIFRYSHEKYSYNVYFTVYTHDDKNIVPVFNFRFMIENPNWKKRYRIAERVTLKGKIKCFNMKSKVFVLNLYYQLCNKLYAKNGKNILFMSETRPYLWGNLKYINDRIIERELDKDFNLTYSFREAVGRNNSHLSWYKTLTKIAKQDYIFVDDYAPIFNFIKLNKKTKLIQVWHAGEGFKAVGFCRFGIKGSPHVAVPGHKNYDYAITGSKRLIPVYSEVFGLPPENILPLGMARLDGFLDKDIISEKKKAFYEKYPSLQNKKIILFAPTYRGATQKSANYDYTKLDLKRIYEFCGDEYIWAFKMHPFVKEKPPIPKEYKDRIFDLGKIQNINDLYYVTEIMITDYSSAYYEFSLMNKPVLFYTYDREMYELIRGVHKPVKETAPGKVCDTFDELMKALEMKDYDIEKTVQFKNENFENYDGKAADRIIDTILLKK